MSILISMVIKILCYDDINNFKCNIDVIKSINQDTICKGHIDSE